MAFDFKGVRMSWMTRVRCLWTMGRGMARGLPAAAEGADPLVLFGQWFEAARSAGVLLPEAMCLSTATPDGQPSSRMVLMKGYGSGQITFFTNRESRKAVELEANPRVALCFHWAVLQRQVRIEGMATRLEDAACDVYFHSRPRGSRLGAWASMQSRTLGDRAELEARVRRFAQEFPGQEVPRPPFWGGYRVQPTAIEFWQGRTDRLHDRLVFERDGDRWLTRRLYP